MKTNTKMETTSKNDNLKNEEDLKMKFSGLGLVGLVWFRRIGLLGLAWYEDDIKNEDDLLILRQPRDESNLKPESDLENRGPPQKNEEHLKK